MSMQLNRAAFQRLIDEDLEWLRAQPRTLERDHVEGCLQHARERYLGGGAWRGEPEKPDGDAQAEETRRAALLPELAEALRQTVGECPCDDDCRSCRSARPLLAKYDEEPGT